MKIPEGYTMTMNIKTHGCTIPVVPNDAGAALAVYDETTDAQLYTILKELPKRKSYYLTVGKARVKYVDGADLQGSHMLGAACGAYGIENCETRDGVFRLGFASYDNARDKGWQQYALDLNTEALVSYMNDGTVCIIISWVGIQTIIQGMDKFYAPKVNTVMSGLCLANPTNRVQAASERIKRLLEPNPIVYGRMNKESSGQMGGFCLSVFAVDGGRIVDITMPVALVIGRKLTAHGVYVSGVGHSHIGAIAEDLTTKLGFEVRKESMATKYD